MDLIFKQKSVQKAITLFCNFFQENLSPLKERKQWRLQEFATGAPTLYGDANSRGTYI